MNRQGLNVPKKAYFGPNLAFFGQKIIIFTGKAKVLVPAQRKNHLGTLFTLFFGRAWDQMGQKCRYLAKKNLAKFSRFWAKNPNHYGSK